MTYRYQVVDKYLVPAEDVYKRQVSAFVATSDGLLVQSPQTYRKAEKRLKRLQREVSRRKKGSNRRRKSVQKLASVHEKIANQRKDIAHKTARYLVNNYDLIALSLIHI